MSTATVPFTGFGIAIYRLEAEAKIAYGIWAHRTGATTPFERLPLIEMQAWCELTDWIYSDACEESPECPTCQGAMYCPACEQAECPQCQQETIGCEPCRRKQALAVPDESGVWAI